MKDRDRRDAVFSSLLDALREHVSFAGLLTIKGDRAVGRGDIRGVSIPLSPDTPIGKVARTAFPYVGPIATGEPAVDDMLAQLGGMMPPTAVLLPIVVRDRTVAIAVGHRGTHPIGDVTEMLPLVQETSEAITRILLEEKKARLARGTDAHPPAPEREPEPALEIEREMVVVEATVDVDRTPTPIMRPTHARIEREPAPEPELEYELEYEDPIERAERFELELGDDLRAIEAYKAVLADDPDDMYALVSLERLYRRNEMWDALVSVLQRTTELRAGELDPEDIIRVQLEIGQLSFHVGDEIGAARAYRAVLAEAPRNLDALQGLEEVYEATDQPEKYLDIVEQRLDATEALDEDDRALYRRIASAWDRDFGRVDRAAACLEKSIARAAHDDDTFRDLIQLYTDSKQWEPLVGAYATRIAETDNPTARVDLFVKIAEVCEHRLRDEQRAIEAYRSVLENDPEEPRALDALGRLYEESEQHELAIAVLSELLAGALSPHEQVDLHFRLGRVQLGLGDVAAAEGHLTAALARDANHRPTLELLAQLYTEQRQWAHAVDVMLLVEPLLETPNDRASTLYEAGRMCLDYLDDADRAQQCFRSVLALDPEHVEAARPLARLDCDAERWEQLWPVLDMLLRKTEPDAQMLCEAATCAHALGDVSRAERLLRRCLETDAANARALRHLAELLVASERLAEASGVYRKLLVQRHDVEVLHQLGSIHLRLGQRGKALEMYEEIRRTDPDDRGALAAIVDLQTERRNFAAVVAAKRELADKLGPEERAEALTEIGDLLAERLHDPSAAIASYRAATEHDPDAHRARQKRLELHTAAGQWADALQAIARFIERESSPARRGAYHRAAAEILRQELGDLDGAVEQYERALDELLSGPELTESTRLRAFEAFRAIDEILTSQKAWKQQEQAYRRIIKRLHAGDRLLPRLWHSLGEVYRSRLQHYQSAIEAFEIARELEPNDAGRNAILAELYTLGGDAYADRAIAQRALMLRANPGDVDSYRALFRAYKDAKQYDKAWCVCEALVQIGKAAPAERKLRDTYKSRACARARQPLSPDSWRRLRAPAADPRISAAFEAGWHDALAPYARPDRAFGLRRKDRCKPDAPEPAVQVIGYLASILGIPDPDVYLRPDEPGDVAFANVIDGDTLRPTLVLRAGVLRRQPAQLLMCRLAYLVALLRPAHVVELALPTLAARDAALRTVAPEAAGLDVTAWSQGVRATARRVGLLLSGDLATAAELAAAEPRIVGGPTAADKAADVLLFSVSEDYFALRERLGLTIGA